MSLILRIVIAVLVGIILTSILDYLNVLTPSINALLGLLAAIVVYLGYGGSLPTRRV